MRRSRPGIRTQAPSRRAPSTRARRRSTCRPIPSLPVTSARRLRPSRAPTRLLRSQDSAAASSTRIQARRRRNRVRGERQRPDQSGARRVVDSPWFKRVQTTTDNAGRFTLQPEAQGPCASPCALGVRSARHGKTLHRRRCGRRRPGARSRRRLAGPRRRCGRTRGRRRRGAPRAHLDRRSRGDVRTGQHRTRQRRRMRAATSASIRSQSDRSCSSLRKRIPTAREGRDRSTGQVVANIVVQLEPSYDIAGRIVGAPADALTRLSVRVAELRRQRSDRFSGARTALVRRTGRSRSAAVVRTRRTASSHARKRDFGASARSTPSTRRPATATSRCSTATRRHSCSRSPTPTPTARRDAQRAGRIPLDDAAHGRRRSRRRTSRTA